MNQIPNKNEALTFTTCTIIVFNLRAVSFSFRVFASLSAMAIHHCTIITSALLIFETSSVVADLDRGVHDGHSRAIPMFIPGFILGLHVQGGEGK